MTASGIALEVRQSPGHGLGLFTRDAIPAGTAWWRASEASVLLISRAQYDVLAGSHHAPGVQAMVDALHTYTYYERDHDALVFILDDTRHINHSFAPNSGGPEPFCSVALRDIAAGEEILEDYTAYERCPWAALYGAFGEALFGNGAVEHAARGV